jgi:hypothetical protein
MKYANRRSWFAVILAAAMMSAVPAYAAKHMGPGMMGGPQGQGMQQMAGMMHDMSKQMRTMTDQMGRADMTPEMRKQMTERMGEMTRMMEQMSGMMGRGMAMDADMQKQMQQMRGQMDRMMRHEPATPRKK